MINVLLQSDRPLTSQELSEKLEVSSRTIKRALWDIDPELKEHKAGIVSTKNGYSLMIEDQDEFNRFWSEQKKFFKELLLDDDIDLAVLSMLLTNEYVTQDDLADESFVSRSTLNKHIKNIKNLLEKEKIILGNRPHYGYYLIGQESDIRNYIVKLLLPSNDISNPGENRLIKNCRDYPGFFDSCRKLLAGYNLDYNDLRIQSIIKYFVVTANRCKIHQYIGSYSSNAINIPYEKDLMNGVKDLIEKHFSVSLNEDELTYLSLIIGNKAGAENEYDIDFFEKVVDKFFEEIQNVYQQNFFYDETLRKGLIQHLYVTYSRLYINAFINNPLIDVIKTKYVEAYNYAVLCGNVLFNEYGLYMNEDSLSYVAIHFAAAIERMSSFYKYNVLVVCDSGFGMAELLKHTVSNRIRNVEVVAAVSSKDLENMDLSGITMIISSVPIREDIGKPVLVVNLLNFEEDALVIEKYLQDCRDIEEYRKLFSPDRFFTKLKVKNKEELLDYVTGILMEKELINEENKKDIYHREEISSTEINKYVGIPHCILDESKETFFSVATLDQDIDWGRGQVSLVFIGAIARNSTINKKVFPMIYQLTMDSEKVKKLINMTDFDEFMNLLFSNLPVW